MTNATQTDAERLREEILYAIYGEVTDSIDGGIEGVDDAVAAIMAIPAIARAVAAPDCAEPSEPCHASDCAVHNAPAFEPGPCDCGLEIDGIEGKLRQRLQFRYQGVCTCGRCQLVPAGMITEAADEIRHLSARLADAEGRAGMLSATIQSMTNACTLVLEIAATSYQARNGRRVSIEADDGERCWIVHVDGMVALDAAAAAGVSALAASTPTTTTEGGEA